MSPSTDPSLNPASHVFSLLFYPPLPSFCGRWGCSRVRGRRCSVLHHKPKSGGGGCKGGLCETKTFELQGGQVECGAKSTQSAGTAPAHAAGPPLCALHQPTPLGLPRRTCWVRCWVRPWASASGRDAGLAPSLQGPGHAWQRRGAESWGRFQPCPLPQAVSPPHPHLRGVRLPPPPPKLRGPAPSCGLRRGSWGALHLQPDACAPRTGRRS